MSFFGSGDSAGKFGVMLVVSFNGVLNGDLKGCERVWDALSIRRRFAECTEAIEEGLRTEARLKNSVFTLLYSSHC